MMARSIQKGVVPLLEVCSTIAWIYSCLQAFCVNIGSYSITRAKLRRIIIWLDISWDSSHCHVTVESDSQIAISLISSEDEPMHHHAGRSSSFVR
ncbi:hypothetical protein LINPERHAP2_LOCUS24469 [Linum perenne]